MNPAVLWSGGGANGAVHVGVAQVLDEAGITPRVRFHAGVSAGALVALPLAQGRPASELEEIWLAIQERDVHIRRSWAEIAAREAAARLRIGRPPIGLWDHRPLRRLIEREARRRPLRVPLMVGYVRISGRPRFVPHWMGAGLHLGDDEIDAIWASCTMPVWDPVEVAGVRDAVDGGVLHVSPIGAMLDWRPRHLILAYTQAPELAAAPPPRDTLGYLQRTLDVMLHGALERDLGRFQDRNHAVRVHRTATGETTMPGRTPGQIWRYYDATVIRPPAPPGDSLDFRRATIAERIRVGEEAARKVLAVAREAR